jgi:hypothetical protein
MHLQLPLPEKPDTEDEDELKKWKWKTRSIKKINSERHSLRCDLELKLAVRFLFFLIRLLMSNYFEATVMKQTFGKFCRTVGVYSGNIGYIFLSE